jgi:hypothetical protein
MLLLSMVSLERRHARLGIAVKIPYVHALFHVHESMSGLTLKPQ